MPDNCMTIFILHRRSYSISMFPVFVYQEKGALFGVILKKTPKATVDATEVSLYAPML